MEIAYGFRLVGTETTSTGIAGNANTKLAATLAKRSGVIVCNQDATYELRVRLAPRGAAAPTYANGTGVVRIAVGGSANIAASESVDVYICNSSNAGTTTTATYQDYAY